MRARRALCGVMIDGTGRRLLVAESETAAQRRKRRADVGRSEGESFADVLRELAPGAEVERIAPSDADVGLPAPAALGAFDAVFVTGSPVHAYDDTPEVRRQRAFMRAVFDSGVPGWGSCAGLQLAVAAAGGRVRRMPERKEVGIARRLTATEAGRDHPMLAGRPAAWDALTIHFDEVEALPDGAVLLAGNGRSDVHAAEIRSGKAVFWGVQYHPELSPAEIGAALRRQAEALVEEGLATTTAVVGERAALFERLEAEPDGREVRWLLGIDDEVALAENRRRELCNFLRHVVGGGFA